MNNIKNMVESGNLEGAISQISPEMIQNFSKMLSNNQENKNQNQNNSNETTSNQKNDFDFSNIDMNTIMKMSSALGQMGKGKNDPRANLLNSLKPYLRKGKKDKLDNYINLLNVAKIAEIVKDNNNKENKKDV